MEKKPVVVTALKNEVLGVFERMKALIEMSDEAEGNELRDEIYTE